MRQCICALCPLGHSNRVHCFLFYLLFSVFPNDSLSDFHFENTPIQTYSKTGVYRGIHYFSFFLLGSIEYPQSMFWAEIWRISEGFLSENFQFLDVNFSIYLNRRVFVMRQDTLNTTIRQGIGQNTKKKKKKFPLRVTTKPKKKKEQTTPEP